MSKPWAPPPVSLENAHSVRKLKVCIFCNQIGTSLLQLTQRSRKNDYAHGYCFVKERGIVAMAALPAVEVGKVTLSEMRALEIPVDVFLTMLDAADARER